MSVTIEERTHKPPMEHEELRDAISLSLWAGQMLLQHGADTQRIEETIHRLGTGLGADWMDILVMPDGIIASTINNHEFRTKVRRAPVRGVNMEVIAHINELSRRVSNGELDRFGLRQELRQLAESPSNYNRWMIVLGIGIACASFSRLFGGDEFVFVITFIASSIAMIVRQELHHRNFNVILNTIVTACVAGTIASFATLAQLGNNPTIAISASVLLLVPGLHLINSVKDILHGYTQNGLARGVYGFMITLGIALGLAVALWITGVNRL
jgi:uncharacterized membrane protein YjjP (DUF1212 family)